MATTRRTTQKRTPADPAAALTAEMVGACALFELLEVGDNEARWARLVELCEADWRASNPEAFPPARVRSAAAARFDAALPKALRADSGKLSDWQTAETNIHADAGFRLGLAMGRGGAR